MISFELTEDQAIARDAFRDLARDLFRPAARQHDQAGGLSAPALDAIRDAGLVSALIDADTTAQESRSRILSCLLLEELGWADASLAVAVGATLGFVQAAVDYGTPAQVDQIRAAFRSSKIRHAAVAVQEPGFGATPGMLSTEATLTGDGYKLSGAKSFLPGAPACDYLLVVARLGAGHEAFLVDASWPGVEQCSGPGSVGLRGMRPAEVRFHDVVAPATARLGGNRGANVASIVDSARIGTAAVLTGLARGVFEHITPYTKERVVFGTPLAQKQSVAFRLADMFVDIPAMRWMTWRAALDLEAGRAASRHARLAQIYCGERARTISDEGVQLMGGHGYMRENPVERWYRDAQTLSLLEGLVGV